MRTPVLALTLAFVWSALATADSESQIELLAKRIDARVSAAIQAESVEPAKRIDDRGFLRRLTLDLAGRIPTVAEQDAYLSIPEQDRRKLWVKRLLESPDFAFHQRNQIDLLLLLRQEHNDAWREYLLEATRENRSWDQLFREIMTPEDTVSTDVRPVSFLKRRLKDLDAMTNDSSVTWFGVNIACAKCHDHPLVIDWTQAHYYGMSAFFKRTFITKKGFLSERFDGLPKYTDIGGDEHQAELMFLTGARVESAEVTVDGEELKALQKRIKESEKDAKAEDPPRPQFRPRQELVKLAMSDQQNRFFARNIANRLWARFFGRGIVHPLDQMHSENPPSHPELLSELAEEMERSGYDLRHLIHAIVSTDAYARTSQYTDPANEVSPDLFAVAVPRALTPRQLSLSFRVATTEPDRVLGIEAGDGWSAQREQMEKQAESVARKLEIPDDGFQVSVTEALWYSNHPSIEGDFLSGSGDRLIGYLKQIDSEKEAIDAMFHCVLSREPSSEEQSTISTYLENRKDRREDGLKQAVWALMGSPEFRFNY